VRDGDPQACPTNAFSVASSDAITDCYCNANYYGLPGGTCNACPTKSVSAASSYYLQNCLCTTGYTGANGAACSACAIGTYKSSFGK
jgi:hypothetical protein